MAVQQSTTENGTTESLVGQLRQAGNRLDHDSDCCGCIASSNDLDGAEIHLRRLAASLGAKFVTALDAPTV